MLVKLISAGRKTAQIIIVGVFQINIIILDLADLQRFIGIFVADNETDKGGEKYQKGKSDVTERAEKEDCHCRADAAAEKCFAGGFSVGEMFAAQRNFDLNALTQNRCQNAVDQRADECDINQRVVPAIFLADICTAGIAADLLSALDTGIRQRGGVTVNNKFAAAPPDGLRVVHHRVTRRICG